MNRDELTKTLVDAIFGPEETEEIRAAREQAKLKHKALTLRIAEAVEKCVTGNNADTWIVLQLLRGTTEDEGCEMCADLSGYLRSRVAEISARIPDDTLNAELNKYVGARSN